MKSVVQIDFEVSDVASDLATVSAALDVTPDVVMRRGERDPANDLPRASRWSRRSHANAGDADVATHWRSLAAELVGK